MTEDAKFEEGGEAPLNLGALDVEDLKVISALAQDSVFVARDMTWTPAPRRFAILLNRFRWEDKGGGRHGPERVRSLLVVDEVLGVASQGVPHRDADTILSLLAIGFEAGEDGAGHILLTLAGDGAIRLEVEALGVTLKDVTRPYRAPSGKAPAHRE
ncbi:DUF2948 family protein [Antarcticimicrobium luteum]|uniref:DUF2948 family protein n=1 Tax=Antarcticimicrobium luteum TaxID=2547397 RepID=A0A4R5UQJ8_9RHOB|nr:DUF2948 family protein [Antarcticimicrobium luteum]TDK41161.1 DUF2948 family protein [Antarcticimicrobium luteum]